MSDYWWDEVIPRLATEISGLEADLARSTYEPVIRRIRERLQTCRRELNNAQRARDSASRKPQESRKTTSESLKGFTGLGQKKIDLSQYLDNANLTDIQRDCFSLKNEYDLPVAEVARRVGRHHSTVQYHIERAKNRIEHSYAYQKRGAKRAKAGLEPE